jgi:hypothetical protein
VRGGVTICLPAAGDWDRVLCLKLVLMDRIATSPANVRTLLPQRLCARYGYVR